MATLDETDIVPMFRYTAFPDNYDYIRLLDILPGKGDDVLQCSTVHVHRAESDDTYEPISYSWGKSMTKETIICDGHQLPIMASLAIALRRFRLEDNPRRVWADGICVDQKNPEEKGPQVTMGQDC